MTDIVGWHAHVYFTTPESRETAGRLREQVAARFPTAILGRWHDKPVGPHPIAMYQIAFTPDLFPTLVPFIALHREGLTVLVHPDTLRPKADHAHHALWMGAVLPLDLSILPEISERAPA
jgi:DOPA 4,5-dioxygenase